MSRFVAVLLLCSVFAIASCQGGSSQGTSGKKQTVTIAGSTSVMPFTEKLAEHFMVYHPGFVVNVQGGGSTAGIQATLNNTVDIGMTSRPLKGTETILKETTICYDGIAVVVHPENTVSRLSLAQVRDIFNGRIKNWKELGWVDRRIDAVTREEGSGTRGSFEDLVMKGHEIDDGIMVQDSNGSVKEVVATDPYAVGYVSMGLVDKRVKGIWIEQVAPTVENIKARKYKIVRPFTFLTHGEPSDKAKVFIAFVLGRDGQSALKKEGLISATY